MKMFVPIQLWNHPFTHVSLLKLNHVKQIYTKSNAQNTRAGMKLAQNRSAGKLFPKSWFPRQEDGAQLHFSSCCQGLAQWSNTKCGRNESWGKVKTQVTSWGCENDHVPSKLVCFHLHAPWKVPCVVVWESGGIAFWQKLNPKNVCKITWIILGIPIGVTISIQLLLKKIAHYQNDGHRREIKIYPFVYRKPSWLGQRLETGDFLQPPSWD